MIFLLYLRTFIFLQNRILMKKSLPIKPLKFAARIKSVFLFIFFVSVSGWSQGPGGPYVDAGIDVILECDQGCVELIADFINTGETTQYAVTSIPYDPPFSFSLGNPILSGGYPLDDIWSPALTLPFDFCFFGQTYDEMLVSTNGVITFDLINNEPNGFSEWYINGNYNVPNPNLFLASIFSPYTDLNMSNSGDINWFVSGDAPYRTIVVNVENVPLYGCEYSSPKVTSQVVLYETTNVIEVYIESRPSGCAWINGLAIAGIQNQDGTQGYTPPGRNTGDWNASNEAWRFTPSGNSNIEIAWLDESGTVIGNTASITVCPEEAYTTYTARVTWTLCNGDVVTTTGDVTVFNASPRNVTATNISGTRATIGWEVDSNPDDSYTLDVYETGANPNTAPVVFTHTVSGGVNSIMASGLELSTTYDAYVTRECSSGSSSTSEFVTFTTDSVVGIGDFEFTNLTVYPNPALSEVNLSASKVIDEIQVYNLLGQKVLTIKPNSSEVVVDVSQLTKGTYILKASIEGVTNTIKLVKK